MLTRIGKYEVLSEIGEGGFGRVYLAYDSSVDRQVAIKILNAQPAPEMLAQFRAEAKTTGNLRHKNIVTVHDFGEHRGVPFLVMELLEGENLEVAIQTRKEISLIDKVHLLHQTAEGLHYAHQKGVIHRDVKPANIMLLPTGSIKIMDFGIANIVNLSATKQSGRHSITGTTRYMAPEQFRGEPADVQTDIFSFGLVCYECISGTHPFLTDGENRMMFRTSTAKTEALQDICPTCPEILAAAISRAMADDRDIRYQSLEDMLLDFQPILLETRRKYALELMADVEGCLDNGESARAQAVLKQVLELDPSHDAARALLENLRATDRKINLRRRIEENCANGAARFLARDFGGAIESFESALRGDSSLEQARIGLDQARSLLDASRSSARLLSNARREAISGKTSEAFLLLEEALAVDPGNDQAIGFRRELTVSVAVAESRELRDQKAFDAAETVLRELKELSQDPTALNELAAVQRDREYDIREKRRIDFENRRASLEHERVAGNWPAAIGIAEGAKQVFAEHEAELEDLIWELREQQAAAKRAKTIQDALQNATARLSEDSFAEAIEALAKVLQVYPRERALLELMDHARALLLESEVKEEVRIGDLYIQEARNSGDWERALEHLAQAYAAYPMAAELQRMRTGVEEAIHERDSLAEWHVIRSQASDMLASKPGEAVALLLKAAEKHGERLEYPPLLEIARTETNFRERLGGIQGHMEQKDWRKAGASLESLSLLHPDRQEIDVLALQIAEGQKLERIESVVSRVRRAIGAGNFVSARNLLQRIAGMPDFGVKHAALEEELASWETAAQSHSCPKCEIAAPAEAKFCDTCGAKIPVAQLNSEFSSPAALNK